MRQPNLSLRDALAEAGWTGQQLADAVNAAGGEIGAALSYDRTAVAHWLAGTRPRSPVPELLAEVFSRQLGRLVTMAELGLSAKADDARLPSADAFAEDFARLEDDDVADALAALAESHVTGSRTARQPAYNLAALAVPGWSDGRAVLPRRPPPARAAGRGVTVGDVAAAERMARLFSTCDVALGGGYVRQAAVSYLAIDLAPKLRVPAYPARRRRLFAAATEIAYICAFTCFDDELHGLGLHYYRAALRLAAENGDQAAYAITLRGMSVQAESLGHHQQARRLAEVAADSVRHVQPVQQAFLLGQLAVARAAHGDRPGALASLNAAERRLDQATSAASLIGAYHAASLAHQQAAVRSLLGDKQGAITALAASVRLRPRAERRAHAITVAALAELQLGAGYLDQAVQNWHLFLDAYPCLHSGRVTAALRVLRRSIRPHTRNPAAHALMQRAAAYTSH